MNTNRADGTIVNTDAYQFGTLWQELTNGLGHITSAVVNSLQITERTKQIKEFLGLKKDEVRYDYYGEVIKSQDSGAGIYLATGSIFVILAVVIIIAAKKK